MKKALGIVLLLLAIQSKAQTTTWNRQPFEEASRAIAALENRPLVIDSLKKVYASKWVLGFTFGQRFITNNNKASEPDYITTAELTKNTACYGFGVGRFLRSNWMLGVEFDFLPIAKEQHVNNLSINSGSINVDATGSGGAMFNLGLVTKHYVPLGEFTRGYLGVKGGIIKAGAGGGSGGFSSSQGQFKDLKVLVRSYGYGNLTLGISMRLSPVAMFDMNAGYMHTTRSSNIGIIESPVGITASMSLQIIIGGGKGLY